MKRPWVAGMMIVFLFAGCLLEKQMQIREGDWVKPYESLGNIEVKVLAAQSFTFNKTKLYKRLLQRELRERSRQFGAEGLAHVEYWPDLSGESFPDGFVYARAEMIQHKKFLDKVQSLTSS